MPLTRPSAASLALALAVAVAACDDATPPAEIAPGVRLLEDDFTALANTVADADVVALGESIHTSEGFSRAKYEIVRYLVEEMGFRAFALENPWIDADRVAAYVQSCDGDPVELIRQSLFRVWGSQSLLELVTWLCEYNQTHPDDPAYLFGFDMQQPWNDHTMIASFLEQAAPGEDAATLLDGLTTCDGYAYTSSLEYFQNGGSEQVLTEEARDACFAGITAARGYFDAHESELIEASSVDDIAYARLALRSTEAWQDEKYYQLTDPVASSEARDKGMADLFLALRDLRFPGARTAIWAHNAHIRERGADLAFIDMGTHLVQQLGDAYAAIALTAYDVETNWPNVSEGHQPTPPADSVEAILHDLGHESLLVDLNEAVTDGGLLDPDTAYPFALGAPQFPREQYRAILYLEHSPPMDALFW